MRKISYLSKFMLFAVILFASANIISAQEKKSPANITNQNYEVILQTFVGSNKLDSDKSDNKIFNRVSSSFGYKSYKQIASNYQRILEGGNITYRTKTKTLGSLEITDEYLISVNWNMGKLTRMSNKEVMFNGFVYETGLPLKTGNVTSYEKIGVNLNKVGLEIGKPAVIGSLYIPQADETLFFALTVKEVNN